MLRLPVALVMFPKEDVLIVDAGFAKLVWLNNPKVSNRNWNLTLSVIGKFFAREKFTSAAPGPRRILRPALPYAKFAGLLGYRSATVKALASMHPIRCPRPQSAVAVL